MDESTYIICTQTDMNMSRHKSFCAKKCACLSNCQRQCIESTYIILFTTKQDLISSGNAEMKILHGLFPQKYHIESLMTVRKRKTLIKI